MSTPPALRPEAERATAVAAARARYDAAAPEREAAQKASMKANMWNGIVRWCNTDDFSQRRCVVPAITLCSDAELTAWETQLHAAGYLTERTEKNFIVKAAADVPETPAPAPAPPSA